jgi:phenylalanyl-tRNA synthetase beta chain
VERDFAFVVDKGVEALTAVNAAQGADKTLIESVRIFDQFTAKRQRRRWARAKSPSP